MTDETEKQVSTPSPMKTREDERSLSDDLKYWRAERPDEFIRKAKALQAEVEKYRTQNQDLHQSLCSANNALERLQTEQDLAKDALQAEVDRLGRIVANVHSIATQASVRVDSEMAKFILAEITKARQPSLTKGQGDDMLIDGIDYGDGYTKAYGPCYGLQSLKLNKWVDVATCNNFAMFECGIYRRPMTQAEKDAEAKQPEPEELEDMVVDGYGMDGMPAAIKIDESEMRRIIAMVREHDAKQKDDKRSRIGWSW